MYLNKAGREASRFARSLSAPIGLKN